MSEHERDLLLTVALIVLARHNAAGPDANSERNALRRALSPFKAEIEAKLLSHTLAFSE